MRQKQKQFETYGQFQIDHFKQRIQTATTNIQPNELFKLLSRTGKQSEKMQGNRNYDTQLPTHTNSTMPCAMCKCNIRLHTQNWF